jgi:hypothetical protein
MPTFSTPASLSGYERAFKENRSGGGRRGSVHVILVDHGQIFQASGQLLEIIVL